MKFFKVFFVFFFLFIIGCDSSGPHYKMYRKSMFGGPNVHVATFDANQSGSYNQINCKDIANIKMKQPDVKVSYWCEKE